MNFDRSKIKYVPRKESREERLERARKRNQAGSRARNLIKSERDRYGTDFYLDYQKILNGGCFYYPEFFGEIKDRTIFDKLKEELANNEEFGMVKWNQHFKHENPDFSQTFNEVVKKMADHFNVEVFQTRLNYYNDGLDWKSFHHDSHKYGNKQENFTMGASFGDTRDLVFLHEESGNRFNFEQTNNCVFSFNKDINSKFKHGVPKTNQKIGPRFSIIAWGKKL